MFEKVCCMCSSVFGFLVMCWLHFIIGVFIDHISIVFSASIFIKIKIAIQFSFGINYVALFLCKVKLFRVILAAFGWEPRMCGKKTLNLLGGTLWLTSFLKMKKSYPFSVKSLNDLLGCICTASIFFSWNSPGWTSSAESMQYVFICLVHQWNYGQICYYAPVVQLKKLEQ